MTHVTTSLAAPASAREEWQRFTRFLRRPELPLEFGASKRSGLLATIRFYGIDMLIMAGLVATLIAVLAVSGLDLPKNALEDLELGWSLAALMVIAAPLGEEFLFRGWLSGRTRHLLAVPALLTGLAATAGFGAIAIAGAGLWSLAILVFFTLLAIGLFWTGRNKAPARWFARVFPLMFWFSTLAFALVHLLNYQDGAAAFLLPLVLPQFVLGAILGYLRVTYGLWASILLHAMHNATVLALVATGSQLAL